MARFIPLEQIDREWVKSQVVAIIGYGSQGHAHAQNLSDQGVDVVIGQRPGKSFDLALHHGFQPMSVMDAAAVASVVMITLPDQVIPSIFEEEIIPVMELDQMVMFAHGFSVVFGLIKIPDYVDVSMIAPKGPGTMLRRKFQAGEGFPCIASVHQDFSGEAQKRALSYAWGIGCGTQLVMETTFREETVCDLFGEQAVLCGGIPGLVKAGFEILVEAGYSPEAAYFECVHEVKLIADLLYERGVSGMRSRISQTAAYGGLEAEAVLVDEAAKTKMKEMLQRVETGEFASQWMAEHEAGSKNFDSSRADEASEAREEVGRKLRSLMGIEPNG